MRTVDAKPVAWIGSSHRDFVALPDAARDHIGYALYVAQTGGKHADAKPLKGFGGAGVLEVISDHDGDTFRAEYCVRFETAIHALDAFPKKFKTGRGTPVLELEMVARGLKIARDDYASPRAKD